MIVVENPLNPPTSSPLNTVQSPAGIRTESRQIKRIVPEREAQARRRQQNCH